MNRRLVAALVGIVSLGLLITPAAMGPAQASPGTATIAVTPSDGVYYKGATILIAVDFPTEALDEGLWGDYPRLSLFTSTTENGSYTKVATGVKSTQDGKYTFAYRVGTSALWIKAGNDKSKKNGITGTIYNDGSTVLYTPAVQVDPKDPYITLNAPDATGKTFTATFGAPAAKSGQTASLQLLTIPTSMTNEVANPAWKTIKTAKQTSAGKATFSISDPYEVKHIYRVITGTSPVYPSNDIEFAAPSGSKATGLSQVRIDSNEGASVNTRTRYFEGQFSMTASSTYPKCEAVTGALAATKGRGNYSWSFAKKSFTVKLDTAADLCGMGTSKKWALVANHYDKSLLRNTVAGYIGTQLTNIRWTPKSRPVDLWMNGSYRGSYILIERVAAQVANAPVTDRIPYTALKDNTGVSGANTPGYIMEWDFRKGADKNVTAGSSGSVGLKDPEFDLDKAGVNTGLGINQDQVNFIRSYLDECDKKNFANGGWQDCIDKDSAIDYYIGMELMKPVDGNMWASVYMWKPKDGKLQFGPMWDFDLAAGSANRAGGAVNSSGWYLRNVISTTAKQSTKTWFNRLNEDPSFRSAVKTRWQTVYPALQSSLTFLDTEKANIRLSASENFKKWSVTQHLSTVQVVKGSWTKEITYLRKWLSDRLTWMNGQLK